MLGCGQAKWKRHPEPAAVAGSVVGAATGKACSVAGAVAGGQLSDRKGGWSWLLTGGSGSWRGLLGVGQGGG